VPRAAGKKISVLHCHASHPNAASCVLPRWLLRSFFNQSGRPPSKLSRLPCLVSDSGFIQMEKKSGGQLGDSRRRTASASPGPLSGLRGRPVFPQRDEPRNPVVIQSKKRDSTSSGALQTQGGKIQTEPTAIQCCAAMINPWFSCQSLHMPFCRQMGTFFSPFIFLQVP